MQKKWTVALAVLALAASALPAAGKVASDAARLQGTWTVTEGVYADGSLEKDLDMSFTFKAKTMTNPMDDSEIAYSVDEKAKTITATGADATTVFSYRIVDDKNVEFTAMKVVKGGKETVIIGDKGTFKLMKLAKKS